MSNFIKFSRFLHRTGKEDMYRKIAYLYVKFTLVKRFVGTQ